MDRHNRVLRLFLVNWALGIFAGFLFASAILAFDIAHIRSLLTKTDFAIEAIALLYVGLCITCGGVVCASAVMRLPAEDDGLPPGKVVVSEANLIEARITAPRGR